MTPQREAGADTGNNDDDGGTLIFVSDASAEAERLTTALRARGYPVIDVPLALLVSRVSVQRPSLILCDADAGPALETIQRVRETPGGNRIDVLFLGEPGQTVDQHAGALQQEASGVFVRPVDEFILLRKVEALIGAPSGRAGLNTRSPAASRAPVLVAATRRPYRYDANKTDARRDAPSAPTGSAPIHPSPSETSHTEPGPAHGYSAERELESQPHSNRPATTAHAPPGRSQNLPQARLSPALESLLATAERRVLSVRNASAPPSDRLSPEAELEAILPADVLDALDEPLDYDDEDEDADSSAGTNNGSDADPGSRSGTKTTGAGATNGGLGTGGGRSEPEPSLRDARETSSGSVVPPSEHPESASARATEPPVTPPRHLARVQSEAPHRAPFEEPAPSRPTSPFASATAHGPATDFPPSFVPPSDAIAVMSTVPPGPRGFSDRARGENPAQVASGAAKVELPASLGVGDAVRAFARVVRARYTGALAFEDAAGIRRVLFRDGDFVTAASGAEGESLVAFLTQRGDLPNEAAARLGRKLPQFGRHAGAALIAQGHLRQDDLWPVLRAHAEWLVGRIVLMSGGAVGLEADVPARMQAEPAVFGGATGAEVLVEIVRRVVSPEEAVQRLGGPATVLQKGETASLLGECAIVDSEAEVVRGINEEAVGDVLRRVGHKDFAAVVLVLVELSVLGLASGEPQAARVARQKASARPDHLDHVALRARILARKALSEEGDYFALLGVPRSATSYDIRRAYSSLRDEYDPTRILTGETVDLREDVELILEVLAEAFEILEDDVRRDRYRRALDASP
ncbi:MAG: hypothetical protein ABJB12_09135 [Pseudomonadota bacterium]